MLRQRIFPIILREIFGIGHHVFEERLLVISVEWQLAGEDED